MVSNINFNLRFSQRLVSLYSNRSRKRRKSITLLTEN